MDAYTPALQEHELQDQVRTLMCYLWDNFLQLYAADEIFLMGVGNAYVGVKLLLINRGTAFSTALPSHIILTFVPQQRILDHASPASLASLMAACVRSSPRLIQNSQVGIRTTHRSTCQESMRAGRTRTS